jgi:lysophospholipase L1-like esterase
LIGHNDFLLDGAPSGLGLNPGEAGYAGSYKDNVQRIIDAVKAAGKTVILAKAPPVLPVNGTTDNAVQQYNLVIAELAANPANGIPIAPPDFHSFFESRTATEYFDTILLNGLGYQSMAQIWLDALTP